MENKFHARRYLLLTFFSLFGCSQAPHIDPSKINDYSGELRLTSAQDANTEAGLNCYRLGGLESYPVLYDEKSGFRYFKYKCNGLKQQPKDADNFWCSSSNQHVTSPSLCKSPTTDSQIASSYPQVIFCASLSRNVIVEKELCPPSIEPQEVILTKEVTLDKNFSVQYLRQRLKEAEAKESADKRTNDLVTKQAVAQTKRERQQAIVKETADILAQKKAEADKQRIAKLEAVKTAEIAKKGDGSMGDLYCKSTRLEPTTPKYLTCRKNFDEAEELVRVTEIQRQRTEDETKKANEQAKAGDGTQEHQVCFKFGFVFGSSGYADCRLKLEVNLRDAAQRQIAYEAEQRRFQAQLAAAEKEKERQKSLGLLRFGLALMGGTSPNFSDNVKSANQSMGWTPTAAPPPPQMQPFMINTPKGLTTCTVVGNMYNCF